jgi:hypothetical protein
MIFVLSSRPNGIWIYWVTGVLIMLISSLSFLDDKAKVLSTAPVVFRDGAVNYFFLFRLSNKLIKQSSTHLPLPVYLCERPMAQVR